VSHSLKDSVSNAPDNLIYEFGPFLLEPHARRLSRHGELVPLAAPEFEILLLLVRNRGRVVEKSEIMAAVWPDVEVEENNLTVRVSSLRRALGETKGYHPYIQTVTGRGYCLITRVTELTEQVNPNTDADSQPLAATISNQPVPTITPRTEPGVRRKLKLKGVRLYALLLIPLLGAGVIYAVLWWRKSGETQAPTSAMKISRVTYTGQAAHAAIAPDGKTIAYVERNDGVYSLRIQRVGTNNHLEILPPAKVLYRDPAFSPDGNTLYYSKCQPGCKLHKIPVLGGVETALPIRADCAVAFSPDGKKMSYLRTGVIAGTRIVTSLLIANADGSGEEEIYTLSEDHSYQSGTPAWSPDGKTIAFSVIAKEDKRPFMKVIGIGVYDRKEVTLTPTPQQWRQIGDVSWSPDGESLIINGRAASATPEATMQLWRVPLNGGEPRRITNDLNTYMNAALSTDGSTLLAVQVQWTAGLWTAPSGNPSSATPLTRGTIDRRDGYLGLSIMPDGRVVYASSISGKVDLWSVNADGSGVKQLTDVKHNDLFPAVTPDARYIVFQSTRDGPYSIWRVDADGRNPVKLTPGPYDKDAVCSPDGKWVIYAAQEDDTRKPTLRKVSIDGGEPIPLTDEFAQHPTISPDGKLIAYHRIDEQRKHWIVIIPAEGGAPIKVMPVPKNFGLLMQWTPEGDAIAYQENTMAGLWKLPIDGTPPSQLIELRGDRLHYFRYSHDGRRLVYASGPTLMDVILVTKFN
jgi:Tol biopolymer transport system component/DNA-binding winged helix-turn-helix (wHTH) protein